MMSAGLFIYKNSQYNYEITCRSIFIEEYGNAIVYGIKIYNDDNSEYSCVNDISEDLGSVDRLCRLMCDECVYPVHLADIAEDFAEGAFESL